MVRALIGLLLVASAAVADPVPGKGYPPVTADDVPLLKLNHYFTPDNKGHDRDFAWTFTKDGFTVKKDKGAIPADLLKKLLPDGATADEITGKWKVENGTITFTGIKAGDKAGREKASYSIYRTAPTVVRIGEPQYVFAVERR